MNRLAPRHQELMKLMVKGLTRKEAAGKMGIAHSTARMYVTRAMRKLHCRTTEQLMYTLGLERGGLGNGYLQRSNG